MAGSSNTNPSSLNTWATDAAWSAPGEPWDLAATKADPAAIRSTGLTPTPVAANHLNWLFSNVGTWLRWLKSRAETTASGEVTEIDSGGMLTVNGGVTLASGSIAAGQLKRTIAKGLDSAMSIDPCAYDLIVIEASSLSAGRTYTLSRGGYSDAQCTGRRVRIVTLDTAFTVSMAFADGVERNPGVVSGLMNASGYARMLEYTYVGSGMSSIAAGWYLTDWDIR